MGSTFAGLFQVNDGVSQNDDPPKDFSWLLIAITRTGQPLIIDGSEDFWNYDIIVNGVCALDNGVVIPKGLLHGALYRVDNIKFAGDSWPDLNGECWGPDISGDWTRKYPLPLPFETLCPEFEAIIKIRPVSNG